MNWVEENTATLKQLLPVALTKYAQHAKNMQIWLHTTEKEMDEKRLAKLVAIFKMREKIIVEIQFGESDWFPKKF